LGSTDGYLFMTNEDQFRRKKKLFQLILSCINFYLSKIEDLLSHLFWVILDSWRKPDLEIFVRAPVRKCIEALAFAINEKPEHHGLQVPIVGSFGAKYFYIYRIKTVPFPIRDGGIRPGLSGIFESTSRGTYIRAWCGFMTVGTIFLTTWFGTVLGGLVLYAILSFVQARYSSPNLNLLVISSGIIIFPVAYLGIMLLVTLIGAAISRSGSADILEFVKNVLASNCGSDQQGLFGRQLKPKELLK
jgi:hypothetical protein